MKTLRNVEDEIAKNKLKKCDKHHV